jgi:3-hydroxy acid dehydrogenase/malonic semialdehyde reductase
MSKIIFITGASSGIGRSSAIKFASEGWNLILNARREEKLIELESQITENFGVKTHLLPFDVRERSEVQNAISNLPNEWKNIDLLLNNAGLALGLSKIDDGNLDHWDTMIDTNIKGLLYVTKSVLPYMIEKSEGHIINIGSIAGKEVYDYGNVYCSTKHAVDALNKAMRLDLADYPIKVSAVHPGAVETEFSVVRFEGDSGRAKSVYDGYDNLVPDDIAESVYWIASRPPRVNINELTIMPTAQPKAGKIIRKG